MKILFLSDDFPPHSFGGAGMVAFTVAKEMQRRGHDVQIITTTQEDVTNKTDKYQGFLIHTISTKYDLTFRAYRGLWNSKTTSPIKKILDEFKPDVVHAHNVHTYLSYHSLTLAKKSGARVILTCHDVMSFHFGKFTEFINERSLGVPHAFNYRISPWRQFRAYRRRYNPFRNIVIRHILRTSVDHVIAVSNALKQAMEQNGIKNVAVIHNGIDAAAWQVEASAVAKFKKEYGLEDKKVVLFSGRLEGAKGGWNIVRAFEKISARMPSARLLILAKKDPSAEAKLEYARQKEFADKVIFAGWRESTELHAAYATADVCMNPSICLDTFGLVNIEAMALRKPVVATCFGGSPEIIVDDQTGYIVNPLNVDIMAEKIEALLTDDKKARAFGEAGYARVLQDFSLTKQADAYEKLYKSDALS